MAETYMHGKNINFLFFFFLVHVYFSVDILV